MESSSIPVEVRSEVSQRSRKARWNDFSEFLARRRRPKRVRVLKRRNAIRSVQLSEPLRQRGTSWNDPRREPYPFWDKRSAGYFPRRTCRFWESSKGPFNIPGINHFLRAFPTETFDKIVPIFLEIACRISVFSRDLRDDRVYVLWDEH